MNNSPPTLLVSIAGTVVVIKVRGRASFTASADFKTLVQELNKRGYERFILDLSECLVMDSTFLGVLASAGLKMSNGMQGGRMARMELIQPSARVLDLLENLGVAHLFTFVNNSDVLPAKFDSVETVRCEASREELSRTCLEAHLTLMALNPANVPRFKEVTKFLQEDLEKLQSPQG
jgi:anti-sigma B factor antagonist